MRDISDTNSNPIAAWVGKQIERGFKGFELYARDAAAATLVDRYPADPSPAEVIYADAKENAQGFQTAPNFLLYALDDGSGPHPSRAFSVPAPLPLHEPERFEERNTMRLLLEHIDKQNRVLTQVVPACLAAMGAIWLRHGFAGATTGRSLCRPARTGSSCATRELTGSRRCGRSSG